MVDRTRRIRGWIGLQRYLDKADFGLDLIRNGRKIKIGCKDLFSWHSEDGEDFEYPIVSTAE